MAKASLRRTLKLCLIKAHKSHDMSLSLDDKFQCLEREVLALSRDIEKVLSDDHMIVCVLKDRRQGVWKTIMQHRSFRRCGSNETKKSFVAHENEQEEEKLPGGNRMGCSGWNNESGTLTEKGTS
ncbi:hypothetical protein ACA910_010667 [Epithemia clementina (nom. ined.)]